MLNVSQADVVASPFPHVVKQGVLPPDLFAELAAAFPDSQTFASQAAMTGTASSRTGSGFDIYRGDPNFDRLTAASPAWARFAEYINSEAFTDTFREVFADHLDTMGMTFDLGRSRVDPDFVEPRERLSEMATTVDKIATLSGKLFGKLRTPSPKSLFTRLDIHKSFGGYRKPPHCDRPNRLCSLIVYFTDAESVGMEGGELLLFKHKQPKSIANYERHPRPGDVELVASLKPRANLGVFFPCQNNSYHGVTPVISEGIARDFLYINISGRSRSLW